MSGPAHAGPAQRVVLVTGLSGAGKSTILHTLEDLGYEAVDNLPLPLIAAVVARGHRRIAIGIDSRTNGFCAETALAIIADLRADPAVAPELIYAQADDTVLLRRYTETRRRHPMAPDGRVAEGIAAEQRLTAPLREAADLVLDTTGLPPPALRQQIEQRYASEQGRVLAVTLLSFAYPEGLPREADLVFDARFLRNPHYVTSLRPLTGLDAEVGAYIETDPDFSEYYTRILDLLRMILPRFVQEGKKYATVAVGCTGGRHRSVHIVERAADELAAAGWRVARSHRELARERRSAPSQAQEA